MAAEGGGTTDAVTGTPAQQPTTVADRLFAEGYAFDFFQAVRLLQALAPDRVSVGQAGPPGSEAVRFRAHLSLNFPPSSIYDIEPLSSDGSAPVLTQSFLGLTGPSGVLPRHYTELLLRLEKESKSAEKHALRDWLDLFNHRLVSLFYRAWEKYRFTIPYERGDYALPEPDTFTRCLLSLVGLGLPALRDRLNIATAGTGGEPERILARVDDLSLIAYGGLLSHRPRNAVSLEALLGDYFQLPARVGQFQGQWMCLEPVNQSRLGETRGNNRLGLDALVGERVWDQQGKVRVRLGPLRYDTFLDFLPDRAPVPEGKAFFSLAHLIRLYAGPDLDFDVQLTLEAAEVPESRLAGLDTGGSRLGWNSWIRSLPFESDADDAVFEGNEVFRLDEAYDDLPAE